MDCQLKFIDFPFEDNTLLLHQSYEFHVCLNFYHQKQHFSFSTNFYEIIKAINVFKIVSFFFCPTAKWSKGGGDAVENGSLLTASTSMRKL